MKVMLSGDFINVGSKFCYKFGIPKDKSVNILFCNYALENGDLYNNAQKMALCRAFNVNKMIDLTPNYDFSDHIDVIFVNGGYYFFNFIKKIVDAGHDKKIIDLVNNGAIYIGESTGAVMACDFSRPDFFAETDSMLENMEDKYKNFTGFHFANGFVATHMSRYRYPKNFENDNDATYRILNRTSKGVNSMLRGVKIVNICKKENLPYISIRENQVVIINDGKMKYCTREWSHLPVLKNIVTNAEQKIKDAINQAQNKNI